MTVHGVNVCVDIVYPDMILIVHVLFAQTVNVHVGKDMSKSL